jgi:NAD(P)-dependent dehydrogenase (short-subunit alcohol dehydrogenase family)
VSLASKVALVVEGEPDIAAMVCRGLGRDGYTVARAGARPDATASQPLPGDDVAAELGVDVTDVGSTEAMARAVLDRFGRIDVLVNGGGRAAGARVPFPDITAAEWDRCFAKIVRGMWLCCRAVAPSMKERRSGRIITIGSTAPWTGAPGFLHYATANSALIGLTRSLARELGDFDICVNMVCLDPAVDPGDSLRPPGSPREFDACQPALPGAVGPEDLIGPVSFLAGPDSDFITGQSYLVNGGSWLQ